MIALQANSNDATIKSIFTILKIFFKWADGYESFESDGKGGFITLIEKNQIIEFNDLAFKKPGHGIKPEEYKKILGKKAKKYLKENHVIKIGDYY